MHAVGTYSSQATALSLPTNSGGEMHGRRRTDNASSSVTSFQGAVVAAFVVCLLLSLLL